MTTGPLATQPMITARAFGQTSEGEAVDLFTLRNAQGMEVQIATYGATVTSIRVPDARGEVDDVVLGFDSLDGYLGAHPFFGGTIGRFGNRIARGRFELDGHEYSLTCNNGGNHLHGGARGFDRRMWTGRGETSQDAAMVRLRRRSPDGEEGYPGNLDCEVVYALTAGNELHIEYRAISDAPTVVNLTHHSYFNLAGRLSDDILGHQVSINAAAFLPVDETQIPTGEVRDVLGTAFDLRQPKTIGDAIRQFDAQLGPAHGFDHNFVLNEAAATSTAPRLAARVFEPLSGRVMEVVTTEPGLQLYVGGFLDGTITGKGGRVYRRHGALCLEAQGFPDAPNQPHFPSTRLDPGETYRSSTIYRFSTDAVPHAWKTAR
ncbi:MAG: aldose epimerase family protein [Vicinamibacteria bacterium]